MPNGIFGFVRNRVLSNFISFAAGGAAASAIDPLMANLTAAAWERFPNRRLTPADLAELVIRGERTLESAAGEAKESGINEGRFEQLTKLAGNPPGPGELLALLNRGVINDERFEQGIRQGRFRTEWLANFRELRRELLTADALANMVVQSVLGEDDARRLARMTGIMDEDFSAMVRLAGNPPGPESLLDLWNRGELQENEVTTGLLQSRLKPEWVDRFKKLRFNIPTLTDMVRFAVREVYSPAIRQEYGLDQDFPDRFAAEAMKHGFRRDDAMDVWAAHWDLPSPQQGFAMFHRDIISHSQLETLLRTLDVMPYWRGRLIQLAHLVPGRIDLRRMFREGVIDEDEVFRGYLRLGYAPEDARRLTLFAKQEKMGKERDLAKGEYLAAYENGAISRDDAKSDLQTLHYSENEAEFILDLYDARRAMKFRRASINVVHARFKDREIDETEAITRLNTIGVATEERDALMELWRFELAENPRHITEAQMRAAWKAGVVEETEYTAFLVQLGYPERERQILVDLYRPAR